MSTSTHSPAAPRRPVRRAAAGLFAGIAVAGAVLFSAQPAQAGVVSEYLYAGNDYAYAEITVNNGTQGRAEAQHGRWTHWSQWSTSYAYAYADYGTQSYSRAATYDRY
jgi:hypothetical protein